MPACIASVSTPREPRAPAKVARRGRPPPNASPGTQPANANSGTPTRERQPPNERAAPDTPAPLPKPYRKSPYSENAARCGSDRSVIVSQAAATSSTEGGSVNVVPSFWNSATRWTLPPPTMNTAAVSGTSSVHR